MAICTRTGNSPAWALELFSSGPHREDEESKPMKNKQEKSDPSTVAKMSANKPGQPGAESAEPREGTEGNTGEQHTCRTPSRESVSQGLERVREAAKQRKKERFTALLHHVTIDLLKDAYSWLKREAAPGVDGRTWQSYKQNLEVNLAELHSRIHRGTYRALPSRRRYIPKPDGRQRPLGIAALEDKIVQRAVVEVLNAIYEEDFLGFSYGFRPGRGQHDALDALAVGITRTKVNWIVDADIAGFFDAVNHEWLMRFVEHRVGDASYKPPYPQVVEGRCDGRRRACVHGGRHAPRGGCLAAAGQYLPPLRL